MTGEPTPAPLLRLMRELALIAAALVSSDTEILVRTIGNRGVIARRIGASSWRALEPPTEPPT